MGKITENGLAILKEKEYFKQGESTWEDICSRVSKTISQGEITLTDRQIQEKELYNAMNNMEFIFSSPALINADPVEGGQYSSCFIIDIKDDLMSIMDAVPRMAKIFQKSGGVGISNLSVLRPKKSRVERSAGYSCGPLGFMKIYNTTAEVMTEQNNSKRGALKMNLDAWHPDIIEFINCKNEDGVLSLMNISVSLSDEFMEAVKEDKMWSLEFPDFENFDKKIYNEEWDGVLDVWKEKGYPVKVYKTIRARELKNMIDTAMWTRGEPGINYQDRMDRDNKNPHLGKRIGTNPCNEYTNLPNTSCTLGSVNLVEFANKNNVYKTSSFDYKRFNEFTRKGVRWLDDMVSVNHLPLKEIQDMTENIRSVGLGVMGFASLLYKLRIRYGSNDNCLSFVEQLMSNMSKTAIEESIRLANERGEYPEWVGSVWNNLNIRVRNSDLISIAPNGTISSLAGVSGGIEPEFALVYSRRTNNGEYYDYVNDDFLEAIREEGLDVVSIIEKVKSNHGSCQGIEEIPEWIREVFVTAHDITPEEHVKVLAKFQSYVDLSISKTINFKNDATVEDIKNIIDLGWELGCKGIAVYRDGCRKNQTLSSGSTDDKKEETKEKDPTNIVKTINKVSKEEQCATCTGNACGKHGDTEAVYSFNNDHSVITASSPEMDTVSRTDFGDKLSGNTYSRESACGRFYVTLNRDPRNGKIIEAFVNVKNGLCKSNVDANTRLISLCLRNGIPMEDVIEQLKGISCSACTNTLAKGNRKIDGISCPDIMAKLLEKELNIAREKKTSNIIKKEDILYTPSKKEEKILTLDKEGELESRGLCPGCGHELPPGRCIQCSFCGYTTC